MSSYRLDRVLLVISTCKFCRGCVTQFEGSGATSGRQGQRFLHRDNALRHTSLVVQQFLAEKKNHSCHHPTAIPSVSRSEWILAVAYTENEPQAWMTSDQIWSPNSGRFQMKPSAGASNNDRIDGASVFMLKGPTLKVISYELPNVLPLQCNVTILGTFYCLSCY
jgi:hypothetical protein